MPSRTTGPVPASRGRRTRAFAATIGDGRTVDIEPLAAGAAVTAFGAIGRTVARLAALDSVDAVQLGVSVPAAWLARVPGDPPLEAGLAWYTLLAGAPETAAGEVRLASSAARLGLGPMLLDTLVLAATERGVTRLTVRLAEESDDYLPALGRYRARFTSHGGGILTAHLSLGTGARRFHWSGLHRRVTGPVDAV